MTCHGTAPEWRLDLAQKSAQFHFPAQTDMEIRLVTQAEGRDDKTALTLIGDRDTAIVLLHRRECGTGEQVSPIEAQVLTQRGQTPILLSGCCVEAK